MAETPSDFEAASVAAIMRHTGWSREECLLLFQCVDEGQRVFNKAKKRDDKTVVITRATLYRLLTCTGALLGMSNDPSLPPRTPAPETGA
jgi:hypothetical protein